MKIVLLEGFENCFAESLYVSIHSTLSDLSCWEEFDVSGCPRTHCHTSNQDNISPNADKRRVLLL